MRHFWLVFVIVPLTLSGCSTIETRSFPKQIFPKQWAQQVQQLQTQRQTHPWWQELHDADLNQLITEAIKANPDALTAESVIRESRAYRVQAKAGLLPKATIGANAKSTYLKSTDATTDIYSAVLDASWEPDIFGSQQHTLAAANAQVKASEASYADVLVTLSAEVATNYITLRGYQAQLNVTQDSLKSWKETLQLTQWQHQAGMVTELDVEQAKRSYEQTAASVPTLKQSILETQNQLAILLGRPPESLPVSLTKTAALPDSPKTVFLPIPTEVLRQRPDVRAAEQKVLVAMSKTDAAKANRWPSFSLGGTLGFTSASIGKLINSDSLFTTLTAGITHTLFDGGALDAQVDVQKEQEKQALYSYKKTVLSALQETENALAGLYNSRESYAALNRALEASKNEEKLAVMQYESGQTNFSNVLDAQRTQLTLKQKSIEAKATELAKLITLSKAIAGNWAIKQAKKNGTIDEKPSTQSKPINGTSS
ncbi:efflux transporter outer membrane subunit [Hydrogenovibrio kuenenii]|uniref:efflux transporter outer membrane subunit n=1 Tax=Hydrogenovibrio kuenenii TaxID=63658 RepID=UPI000465AA54|nr:efflux transporter outer membrane subunit [Hydrogenovibrio kuenenii]